jgi:hypothetical protein
MLDRELVAMMDMEVLVWYGMNIIHRSWTIPELKKWKILTVPRPMIWRVD